MKEVKSGVVFQLTGKSFSGKSSISKYVTTQLERKGFKVLVMDENYYQTTLCKDLGESKSDKIESMMRMANFAQIFRKDYDLIIISAVNPFNEVRTKLKEEYDFSLIHVDCDTDVLLNRNLNQNINKLIKLNLNIEDFGSIEEDFEEVQNADLYINTAKDSLAEAFEKAMALYDSIANEYLEVAS